MIFHVSFPLLSVFLFALSLSLSLFVCVAVSFCFCFSAKPFPGTVSYLLSFFSRRCFWNLCLYINPPKNSVQGTKHREREVFVIARTIRETKMEGRKPAGSSSSSSTSELLGSKDSSSSSSGIFGAIFAPPLNSPKVLSRESLRSELTRKKITDQPLNFHSAEPGTYYSGKEGEGQSTRKEDMSSYYEDQRVQSPCHLSSSIYYGGQDIYNYPQNRQNPGINSTFKKDGTDDDGTACRGNWWQGSLYY